MGQERMLLCGRNSSKGHGPTAGFSEAEERIHVQEHAREEFTTPPLELEQGLKQQCLYRLSCDCGKKVIERRRNQHNHAVLAPETVNGAVTKDELIASCL